MHGQIIGRNLIMSNRVVNEITDNKFVNLYEVTDPDNHCRGYQFAERRGVDSVAFICYDKKTKMFLINCEFTPPTGYFMERAFGGSLDKDGKEPIDIVMEEVEEEAGYKVSKEDIEYVGKCFVSTQMNQTCFLYLVFVSDEQKTERKPENGMEKMATPIWRNNNWIFEGQDWKAISIIMKAVNQGFLKVVSDGISIE